MKFKKNEIINNLVGSDTRPQDHHAEIGDVQNILVEGLDSSHHRNKTDGRDARNQNIETTITFGGNIGSKDSNDLNESKVPQETNKTNNVMVTVPTELHSVEGEPNSTSVTSKQEGTQI